MKLPKKTLENLYTTMLRIRRSQDKIAEIYPQVPRMIQCPVHLCTGQEATPAGVCANLLPGDAVFSVLRSHGHFIAKGGDLKALFAELYGKKTGCCRGRGGSMHLSDHKKMFGTSAMVSGAIPIAVGVALAFQIRRQKKVVISFFGDAACEEGVWHESLNFAALKKLPIVFVCENNFYAVKSLLPARQPKDNIFERAKAYGLPGVRIDGNNVLAVFDAARQAIDRARKALGPTLIEARTYRWRQHCEDTFFNPDILEGRPKQEYEKWLRRCPLKFFEKYLFKTKAFKESDLDKISSKIDKEINEAVRFALKSPFPGANELRQF